MENALPEVKEIADFVTRSNETAASRMQPHVCPVMQALKRV